MTMVFFSGLWPWSCHAVEPALTSRTGTSKAPHASPPQFFFNKDNQYFQKIYIQHFLHIETPLINKIIIQYYSTILPSVAAGIVQKIGREGKKKDDIHKKLRFKLFYIIYIHIILCILTSKRLCALHFLPLSELYWPSYIEEENLM